MHYMLLAGTSQQQTCSNEVIKFLTKGADYHMLTCAMTIKLVRALLSLLL